MCELHVLPRTHYSSISSCAIQSQWWLYPSRFLSRLLTLSFYLFLFVFCVLVFSVPVWSLGEFVRFVCCVGCVCCGLCVVVACRLCCLLCCVVLYCVGGKAKPLTAPKKGPKDLSPEGINSHHTHTCIHTHMGFRFHIHLNLHLHIHTHLHIHHHIHFHLHPPIYMTHFHGQQLFCLTRKLAHVCACVCM